jgi:hypothetical protein
MRRLGLLTAVFALAVGIVVAFEASPDAAQSQPRAHVYLLRGLLNIFSLGMDTLAEELKGRDVYATVPATRSGKHSPTRLLPITKLARKHRSS